MVSKRNSAIEIERLRSGSRFMGVDPSPFLTRGLRLGRIPPSISLGILCSDLVPPGIIPPGIMPLAGSPPDDGYGSR